MNGTVLALASVAALAVAPRRGSFDVDPEAWVPAPRFESARRLGVGVLAVAGLAGVAALASGRVYRAARQAGQAGREAGQTTQPPPIPTTLPPPGVEAKPGVTWSPQALTFIAQLRAETPPSIRILVNSVTRTPFQQANAMIAKYDYAEARVPGSGAEEIRRTYGSKAEAFLAAPKATWAGIVQRMHDAGTGFRDGHLNGTAIDIRTRDLSPADRAALVAAAQRAGAKTRYEDNPPHLHVDGFAHRATT